MNDNKVQDIMMDNADPEEDKRYEAERRLVAKRISELLVQAGVTESKLSIELGHNKDYIRGITAKHTAPSLRGLFDICHYFGITPAQFFDQNFSLTISDAVKLMERLDDEDMEFVLTVLNHLLKKKKTATK